MTGEGELKPVEEKFSVDTKVEGQENKNNLTEAETKMIVESELAKFNVISGMEDKEEQKNSINTHIDSILTDFESTNGTQKDFRLLMVRIELLELSPVLDKNVVDRSWNQCQIDKVIKIFEENEKGNRLPSGGSDYFPRYYSLFTTGSKKGEEKDTVSDLFAESLAKRLKEKKVLSAPLQEEVKAWCNNIHMADKDARLAFLTSVLNNMGKMDSSTSHEAVAFMGLYGSRFIRELKISFEENKNDINKTLRIVEILNFLKNKKDEAGFESAGAEAGKILSEIKKENDNFFIQAHIDRAENPSRAAAMKRKLSYDDEDLGQNYKIVVYGAEDDTYNKDRLIAASCYSRINNKYGVLYDYRGKIDSVFELKDKMNTKEKVKPEKLDIGEVLAKEGFKEENMNGEEYKKMVLAYKTLIELPMREKIENEFGIELKDFNVREQVQFVNFLSSKTTKEVREVKEFLNQGRSEEAKSNRIKSFLSLESGEEMGEKILKIGEKLDAESADAVFAKYAEIVDLTGKSREDLENLFKSKKEISDKEKEKIVQNLMSKANKILIDFSRDAGKRNKISAKEVMDGLEDCKADLILTASVFKGIDKEGEINFVDLEGVEFEKKTASDLSGEEIGQMKKIYAKNYEYNKKFQEVIVKNFENILKNLKEKTTLYLFKDKGEVVAFNRFDDMGEGRKYFGSFNVKPIMSGSDIGKALMQVSLEEESKAAEMIEAGTIPDTPISARYIGGKCGFVVKKLESDYKDTSVPVFDIVKEKENKKYRYFNYSDKQIIDEHVKDNPNNGYTENDIRFILKVDPKSSDFIKTTDDLINKKGYVISNYVFAKGGKEAYCAFEKA